MVSAPKIFVETCKPTLFTFIFCYHVVQNIRVHWVPRFWLYLKRANRTGLVHTPMLCDGESCHRLLLQVVVDHCFETGFVFNRCYICGEWIPISYYAGDEGVLIAVLIS